MSIPFLHDIILKHGNKIQFTTNAGANAGSIDIDNSGNLVLNNTAGDILLGDGASDVYIGDGTNNVDILFEQSGSIKADDSATGVTITLGSNNTTLAFGGSTSFTDVVSGFSPTGTNTIDIGTNTKPFKDIYAAHHVGGSSINYATSRGWVEDAAGGSYVNQIGYYGGNFSRNGDEAENAVVWGLDPFDNKALLWKAIGNTSDDDDDGGWNKDITIPANNNMGYLVYVYFKTDFTPNSTEDGQIYLGCGTASGQTINLDGNSNTNPYFVSSTLHTLNNGGAVVSGRWYLMIGIIQAYNNETTDTDTMSGVYDVETGEKIAAGSEFKMGNNTTGQRHRTYLYYQDSNSAGNVYFWNPGFHAIDGSEPKIQDLVKRQVYLNDNIKAVFGTGDDLQIYHDGSNSYIVDAGTGDLMNYYSNDWKLIQYGSSEMSIHARTNEYVKLFYNGNVKFETYDAGVGITGNAYLTSGNYVHFDNGVTNNYAIRKTGTTLQFKTGGTYDFESGLITVGSGTTGSAYDSSVLIHTKGGSRSIIQQSSTDDAYYMFGDAGANNAAWVGYSHSSGTLSLQSQTNVTINKNTAVTGNISATGSITANAFSGDGSSLTGITATDSTKVSKSGDTITSGGNIGLTINHDDFNEGLVIHRNHADNSPSITFKNNDAQHGILFSQESDENPYWRKGTNATNYKIWHSGNDGSGFYVLLNLR